MDGFLPNGYSVPKLPSRFIKLEDGKNKVRILTQPVVGYVYRTEEGGKTKFTRVHMDEGHLIPGNVDPKKVKHFWAMIAYSYASKKIGVLEFTQRNIQKAVEALIGDEDWGNPLNYDLTITRTGTGLDTEYMVTPSNKGPVQEDIIKLAQETKADLELLFEGKNPFEEETKGTSSKVAPIAEEEIDDISQLSTGEEEKVPKAKR